MKPINTDLLRSLLPGFRSFLETEGKQWQKERQDKDHSCPKSVLGN